MATVVVTVKERIATIPSGVSLVCNNPNVNKKSIFGINCHLSYLILIASVSTQAGLNPLLIAIF